MTTKYCTVCGKVVSTTYGEYGPHTYIYDEEHITVIKDSTCTESGEFKVACAVCGETVDVYAEAEGHEDADGDGICDKCGASMNANEDDAADGKCDKCGRNHAGKEGGIFGYNGIICRIIAFFRMIVKMFGK